MIYSADSNDAWVSNTVNVNVIRFGIPCPYNVHSFLALVFILHLQAISVVVVQCTTNNIRLSSSCIYAEEATPSSRDNSIRFAETKEINDHSVLLSIANGGKTSQPSPTTYYEDEEKPFFLRFSTFFHLIVFTYSADDENISRMWWCHQHQCKKYFLFDFHKYIV